MLLVPVIDRQLVRQTAVHFLLVLEWQPVRPLIGKRLNESIWFSVVSWRPEHGAHVPQPEDSTRRGECLGDVGRPLVSHHTPALNAWELHQAMARQRKRITMDVWSSAKKSKWARRVGSSTDTWPCSSRRHRSAPSGGRGLTETPPCVLDPDS